jgi:hypothetical protein
MTNIEIEGTPEKAEVLIKTGRLWLIDGDCTLWDPYALMDAFVGYWQQTHPEMASQVEHIRTITHQSKGNSQDPSAPEPYSELRRLGVDYLGHADDFKLYCEVHGLSFLNPGAKELLQTLHDTANAEGMIETAGNRDNQTFKLRSQQELEGVPYLIIPSSREFVKVRIAVDTWREDEEGEGVFYIPAPSHGRTFVAPRVTVIDDKPSQLDINRALMVERGIPEDALERIRYCGPSVSEKVLRMPTPPGVHEIYYLRELL